MCASGVKKNQLKPWLKQCWVIPAKENADFVCAMEDRLNVYHKLGSLYATFEPEEAMRIAQRLEIHYTPKHGSWLNMAEIEIGILSRQCLNQRIPDQQCLREQIAAWQTQRNQDNRCINWRFTTDDARIKLKSLYPSI